MDSFANAAATQILDKTRPYYGEDAPAGSAFESIVSRLDVLIEKFASLGNNIAAFSDRIGGSLPETEANAKASIGSVPNGLLAVIDDKIDRLQAIHSRAADVASRLNGLA